MDVHEQSNIFIVISSYLNPASGVQHNLLGKNMGYRSIIICLTILLMQPEKLLQSDAYAEEQIKTNEANSQEILVDDFDEGETEGVFYQRKNSLDFYQGAWSKRPSFTLLSKSEEHRRGDTGKGLVLNYRKESGWCGWYTILGELDVTAMNVLSFWVKGDTGGERFDIGFSDSERNNLEMDAIYAGPITQFIGEVSTDWQEVKIPLSRVGTALDLSKLATIVFNCKYGGEGTIYVDDVKFKIDPDITQIEEANLPKAKQQDWYPRSMWVWKVDPVTNLKARNEVFDLCKKTATEVIYLYFGDFDAARDPQYTTMLKSFLEESGKVGISVEVLTGNPTWALKENHDKAYNWLKPFLDFNRDQPENARFRGVSFDVEPYLASEWKIDKERVKKEYLVLMKRLRKLIDSYPEQNFKFGGAIPTFYIDEGDFEEEILSLTDYAALMDYYDKAEDMIRHAERHLNLAKKLGKKIWIATEIQDLISMKQGFSSNTFFEEGWEFMEEELEKVRQHFKNHPGFGGFATHCYYAYRQLQKGRTTPQNTIRLEKPKKDITSDEFQEGDIYTINAFLNTKSVKIDGKLDEWNLDYPFEMNKKKQVVYGSGAWKDAEDLACRTYSMWDEDNLYFAFEITDNIIMQWETGENIWKGDHLELWLDVDLGVDFTEAVNSTDDFQFGISPGNFNDLSPEPHIWVPSVKPDKLDGVQVGSAKTKNGYTLEVRIERTTLYNDETVPMSITDVIESEKVMGRKLRFTQKRKGQPPTKFYSGYKLGIMADASDTDDINNPQKCLMSSSLNRRWGDPTVFGFLELKGKVEDEMRGVPPAVSRTKEIKYTGKTPSKTIKETVKDLIHGVKPQVDSVDERFIKISDVPEMVVGEEVYLYDIFSKEDQKKSSRMYRGKLGAFQLEPNFAATVVDEGNYFDPSKDTVKNTADFLVESPDHKAIRFQYSKANDDEGFFCGSYVLIMGDLTEYATLTFLIKGAKGGEAFEIGMNDAVSHKREDAVFVGSIERYLPEGITKEWQLVTIPLSDFYGPDLTKVFSLIFHFNEAGQGTFWIDEMSVTQKTMVDRNVGIKETGFLLLDNFDHNDLNLLGRKASTYKKLPSYVLTERVEEPRIGDRGRSLKLQYFKKNTGWTGYYTLLNQIDGEYYDLSKFDTVSFWVRGEKGGEDFELGLADKNWIIIGDSLKAGQVSDYLPDGVTTEWQQVEIPLKDYGQLDLSEMGSFVINFNILGESTVYIDDLKFHLAEQYSMHRR